MRCHATVLFFFFGCSSLLWLTLMGLDQNAFLIQKTQKLADPPKTSFAKFKDDILSRRLTQTPSASGLKWHKTETTGAGHSDTRRNFDLLLDSLQGD
jgi:hypothetical protein